MSWKKTILNYRNQLVDGEFDKQLPLLLANLVEQPNNPKGWLEFLTHVEDEGNENLELSTTLKQLHVHAWSLTKSREKSDTLWELGVIIGKYYW